MNLPNKLTIARMILIIPFVVLMMMGEFQTTRYVALAIFIIASVTDWFDGYSAWIVIIISSREFVISGFRLIASDNGIVIAASWWGKFKTTAQMLMIILLILNLGEKMAVFVVLEQIFIWLALILTVISLIDYIMKNKQVINMQG